MPRVCSSSAIPRTVVIPERLMFLHASEDPLVFVLSRLGSIRTFRQQTDVCLEAIDYGGTST
jgi:hypothetical protein